MCLICASDLSGKDCEFADAAGGVLSVAIPDDASTGATITVGQTVQGSLDFANDQDWYRITLTAGQTIDIVLRGAGTPELVDPYLRLRNAAGNPVAANDDSGGTLDSKITYTVTTSGTYYIEADSYLSQYTGGYELSVSLGKPAELLDSIRGVNRIDDSAPVQVYFAAGGETYTDNLSGTAQTFTASGFNAYERDQLFSIFEGIEAFADIDFEITTNRAAADMEVASTNLNSVLAGGTLLGYFYFPSASGAGGHGLLNDAYPGWSEAPGGGLDAGGFMYGVSIHEFGHGLGLGHPHDTGNGSQVMSGVTSSGSLGTAGLNQSVYTAMSYNDGWVASPNGSPLSSAWGYSRTFGALDIAVLQEFYGANTTHAAGDDVYVLDAANAAGTGFSTIWDTGGTDWIRFDGPYAAVIDLRPATLVYGEGGGGFMSWVSGIHTGFTIAAGVAIENAAGNAGDDLLTGNTLANVLSGRDGADTLAGREGNDSLFGGTGNDSLDGGDGDDLMNGGSGADRFAGGAGRDVVRYADALAGVVASLVTGGLTGDAAGDIFDGVEDLVGSLHADRLEGDAGANALEGLDGDDTLAGGGGDDWLDGGTGADLVDGGSGHDTASFAASAGGIDVGLHRTGKGFAAAGDRLAGIEHLLGSGHSDTLVGGGAGALTLEGGAGNDLLYDYHADAVLLGGGGADILVGGLGADSLFGGDGTDTLFGGDGADRLDGGAGTDTASYAGAAAGVDVSLTRGTGLGGSAEGDTLVAVENLIGGEGADRLAGDSGSNHLMGGGGDDTLDGGAGTDYLHGGSGADTFRFAPGWGRDVILDFEDGIDRIDLTGTGLGFADLTLVDTVQGVRLDWAGPGGTVAIHLFGIDPVQLDAIDFS